MTIHSIRELVANDYQAVTDLIICKIQSQVGLIDDLSKHIVESGGKRLRPILVLLSSHACNYLGQDQINLAAMIECFHTATLLHDDVVDESTLRRGKETANTIWGSKASILVGDYLFTQSVQLMVEVNNSEILQLMANTSHQISCGEVKQLVNRRNSDLSVDDYFDVIRCKTALLFAASAMIGPILAGSDPTIKQSLYDYGLYLGNAFQLVDDALDYCGDPLNIGKNIGDDLADGKMTLPLLYALQHGNLQQQAVIKESIAEGSLKKLDQILLAIETTNAIEYTKNLASMEIDKALSALNVLPDSVYKDGLKDLALFALSRTH